MLLYIIQGVRSDTYGETVEITYIFDVIALFIFVPTLKMYSKPIMYI